LRGFFPNIRNKKEKNKERKDENKILWARDEGERQNLCLLYENFILIYSIMNEHSFVDGQIFFFLFSLIYFENQIFYIERDTHTKDESTLMQSCR
jgi:hypothetical protein